MKKIKIYTIYDDYYEEMLDLFKESFEIYNDYFEIVPIFFKSEKKNKFQDAGFCRVLIKKLELIKETILENKGETIIWSDVDILCIENIYDDIIESSRKYDISGCREDKEDTWLNIGFVPIKCSSKTHRFFHEVLCLSKYTLAHNLPFRVLDQESFNIRLEKTKLNINYGFLPSNFILYHYLVLEDAYLSFSQMLNHGKLIHFTDVGGRDGKKKIMRRTAKAVRFWRHVKRKREESK